MSKHYECPTELRELEKLLVDFAYRNGYDIYKVFDDFLSYIIFGFTINKKPFESWKYPKEQNIQFALMLQQWIRIMERQTGKQEWYDAFGDLYMSLVVSSNQQKYRGQFFTPAPICDLMTAITRGSPEPGQRVCDPTCGSGRMLLSFHAKHPENYLVGEDIDQTCCMMTVCNFLIHGCSGHVIWHNSLSPDSFNDGWMVNEFLHLTGIPSLREITPKEYRDGNLKTLIEQINDSTAPQL